MSASVNITIEDAESRKLLGELAAKLSPGPQRRGLMRVLGRTAERALHRHFSAADESKANQQGWKRSHFWGRIRSATKHDESQLTDDSATVVISDPALKAHLYGGTWGAKEAKNLAIPVNPRVAGKRPSETPIAGVQFMRSKRAGNVTGWLYIKEGKGKTARRTFLWRLQKRVTVRRDPTALPRPEAVGRELVAAATYYLRPRGGAA